MGGLANLHPLKQVEPSEHPLACLARLYEKSNGKDTMTGHWEMMGIETKKPFITFTEHGFPPELIKELEARTGHKVIGNKSASGTEILDELGEEEIATGHMIVYTSADSVLQICGNEETFGLQELYRCCEIARELTMKDEWRVGRVIARPYIGKKRGEFVRTSNRHDYALKPTGPTALNALKDAGYSCISVGKIYDIFDSEGLTESNKSKSSTWHAADHRYRKAGFQKGTLLYQSGRFECVMGHRKKSSGIQGKRDQRKFDDKRSCRRSCRCSVRDDLLILTADHGNDQPTRERIIRESRSRLLRIHHRIRKAGSLIPVTPLLSSVRLLRTISVSRCRREPSELLFWIR